MALFPAVLIGVVALLIIGLGHRAVWAAGSDLEDPVELEIKRVFLVGDSPAVLLTDRSQERVMIMYIDFFMANAIRMGMLGERLERPLTHDLIGIFLRRLGARITGISITGLKGGTYHALIAMEVDGELMEFDARPSDALALAVRNGAAIMAPAALLKPVLEPPREGKPEQEPPQAPMGKT